MGQSRSARFDPALLHREKVPVTTGRLRAL
jgi:hypothetical protein